MSQNQPHNIPPIFRYLLLFEWLFTPTQPLLYQVDGRNTCEHCSGWNGKIFTAEQAEAMFPYLEKLSSYWIPHVHPNCRCLLIPMPEFDVMYSPPYLGWSLFTPKKKKQKSKR